MTAPAPNSFFDHSSEAQRRRVKHRGGSRALLSEKYFRDVVTAWEEQGDQALNRMAFHDPAGFCNMVARLMPQKIEHSTPTDGMSDERLTQLLDIAEKAINDRQALTIDVPATLIHEKAVSLALPEEGGGGPERLGDLAGGGSTSTRRDVPEAIPPQSHNGLKISGEPTPETPNILKDTSPYDDRTPETPYSRENLTPHPVGRPFPRADHEVERANKANLDEEPIDPASLF